MVSVASAALIPIEENKNRRHILTVFGDWWGWEKHIEDFQRPLRANIHETPVVLLINE